MARCAVSYASSLSGAYQQCLKGSQFMAAGIGPTANRQGALDLAQEQQQTGQAGERGRQVPGKLLHGLGRFAQTAIGMRPTTEQPQPMLDQQAQQLGIQLGQLSPGLGAARLVQPPVALPQFEQQLN